MLKDEDTSETEETKDIEVRMKQAWGGKLIKTTVK